ncbi:hypothetical protein SEA_CEN1621_66 [Microbacterium phage Cen1621]|uniref:Uncharacterized protein n=1 Tax=Microbacterium phage Cen1621 TaxID=2965191 RepID=A0A9E7TXL7_9CAUD|nr:hypothetical protein SEA_CEN1621_66 [Microbacterium phage Cen1621]
MTKNTDLLYPELKGSDRVELTCGRCSGTGLYNAPTRVTWQTDPRFGAQPYCFECGGAGKRSVLVSSLRATARRQAKAAEAAKAQAEAFAARVATFWTPERQAARDEATAAHIELREGDPLRRELGYALDAVESLDEAGFEKLAAAMASLAAREAAQRPVPEGLKVEVEGILRSRKWVESDFGGSVKALIEGEGWKVYGTLPRALDEAEVGDRVAFTASSIEASVGDASFGFYKRPTKARIIAKA